MISTIKSAGTNVGFLAWMAHNNQEILLLLWILARMIVKAEGTF